MNHCKYAPLHDSHLIVNDFSNYESGSIEFAAGGRSFTVFANLLPKDHPYQEALVSENQRKVELSEDVAIVRCYVDSLYHQKLRLPLPGSREEDCKRLIKLYGFGENMTDRIFQDHVMEALRCRLYSLDHGVTPPSPVPDTEQTLDIVRCTPQNSKLRRLFAHLVYVSPHLYTPSRWWNVLRSARNMVHIRRSMNS